MAFQYVLVKNSGRGRGYLPTIMPEASLSHGENDKVVVHWLDETSKSYPVTEFLGMVDENSQAWKDLREKISYVDRFLPLDILRDVNIIDSPGLEAIKEAHTKITKSFVNRADVVFWMFSAENVGTATEMKNLENLDGRFRPVAIINKMDTLDEEEDDPGEFLHGVRLKLQGKVAEVLGVSAKYGVQGKKEQSDELLRESNIVAVERYIQREIVPQSATLKINSFLENIGGTYVGVKSNLNDYLSVIKNTASEKDFQDVQTYVQNAFSYLEKYFSRCVDFSLKESEKGNPSADLILGNVYCYGDQNHASDIERAMGYLRKAAKANNLVGQVMMALYCAGNQNVSESEFWLDKAEANYVDGVDDIKVKQFLYLARGMIAELKGDYTGSIPFYETSMELGSAEAANALGRLWDEGQDVQHDYERSAECYRFAAERDEPNSMFNLGTFYYYGKGVEKNEAEALRWIQRAAEQGVPNAQITLGNFYATGECGLKQDAKECIFWLQRAAEQGDVEAKNTLLDIYVNGIGDIKPDFQKFVDMTTTYWSNDDDIDPDLLAVAGDCYFYGKDGVEKDVDRGLKLIKDAAEKDSVYGLYCLAELHILGEYVPQDFDKAYHLMKKSAEQGFKGAIEELPYVKQMKENPEEARARIAEQRTSD